MTNIGRTYHDTCPDEARIGNERVNLQPITVKTQTFAVCFHKLNLAIWVFVGMQGSNVLAVFLLVKNKLTCARHVARRDHAKKRGKLA